jgi:cell division septation protein DedD
MSANSISLKASAKFVWIKRGIALSVLLGFAWLVITAITTDLSDEELNPVVVKAPELVKQRPETPGGMKIDHQDKQLFDILESESSVDVVSEKILKQNQEAALRNEQLASAAIEKKKLEAEKAMQELEAAKLAAKIAEEKAKAAAQAAKVQAVEVKKVEIAKVEPKVLNKEQAKTTVQAVKVEAAKPVAKPVAKTTTVATASGWAVQLGSFRKDADANRAVGVYQKKVGNILTGLNPYVKKVDLGAKGTVYRVYFTGLKDSDHAKQVCSQLKAQKQACLRAKI